MKKFNTEVTKVDEFRVEFDETVINEEWMAHFRKFFYDYYTLEEHADHIAQFRSRFKGQMIEGYGVPLEDGKVPYWAEENQVNKAINIVFINVDNNIVTDCYEVN